MAARPGQTGFRLPLLVCKCTCDWLGLIQLHLHLHATAECLKHDTAIFSSCQQHPHFLWGHVGGWLQAHLENGLLHIDLKRELPEIMKPRSIPITKGQTNVRSIEGDAQRVRESQAA